MKEIDIYIGGQFMKKNSAFTLAEVLITLGIIGIVAAMTLPSLIAKYQDKVLINQAKKSYSMILNAMNMAKAESGLSDYSGVFSNDSTAQRSDRTAQKVLKYMKVLKYCGLAGGNKCFPEITKYAQRTNDGDGGVATSAIDTNTYWAKAILADGSSIAILQYEGDSSCVSQFRNEIKDEHGFGTGEYETHYDNQCGLIIIDVNGLKRPNQYGADTFAFVVRPNKIFQYLGYLNDALVGDTLDYDPNYSLDDIFSKE